ncbi:hypothetical protein ACVDG5_010335 [Mesorhizobium sp. ORM6]
MVEKLGLIEADHLDRRVDHLPRAVKNHFSVGFACDVTHPKVKAGCGLRVEFHLFLASGQPQGWRREIDIRQLGRPLHLVCALANEEDA